jgi:hypothetical protein
MRARAKPQAAKKNNALKHATIPHMKPRLALPAAFLALAFLAPAAIACPNCADTVGETNNAAPEDAGKSFVASLPTKDLANSFNYSIYVMLVVPYTLIIVGGYIGYRMLKKADAKMMQQQTDAN